MNHPSASLNYFFLSAFAEIVAVRPDTSLDEAIRNARQRAARKLERAQQPVAADEDGEGH